MIEKYWNNEELSKKVMEKIEECVDCEELFHLWKEVQKQEPEFLNEKIIPLNKSKLNDEEYKNKRKACFCKDGEINKEKYEEKHNFRILFILKEANDEEGNSSIKWYNDPKDSNKQKEITARMGNYLKNIKENSKCFSSNIEDLKESLDSMSFMNINKRGGFNSSNSKMLIKYYEKYKPFIMKEIEILNPDIIICGVKCLQEERYINEITQNGKISIIFLSHPASSRFLKNNDKNVIFGEKCIIEKFNFKKIENTDQIINKLNEKYSKNDKKWTKSVFKYMMKFVTEIEKNNLLI